MVLGIEACKDSVEEEEEEETIDALNMSRKFMSVCVCVFRRKDRGQDKIPRERST